MTDREHAYASAAILAASFKVPVYGKVLGDDYSRFAIHDANALEHGCQEKQKNTESRVYKTGFRFSSGANRRNWENSKMTQSRRAGSALLIGWEFPSGHDGARQVSS